MALAARVMIDPTSIHNFASTATDTFGLMQAELQGLVDSVVGVKYDGTNAAQFKTDAGKLAVEFGTALHRDMNAMAQSVEAAVMSVRGAMGETNMIDVKVANKPVSAQPVTASTVIDLETAGLQGLTDTVGNHFKAVRGHLDTHKTALETTIWEGNAKERAKSEVQKLTTHSNTQCDDAEKKLKDFIEAQLQSISNTDV